MKKLFFIIAALILLTIAGLASWQIYVPVHEDNISIQAYGDLRQFVELPVPEPLPQPSTSELIPPSISPTQSPNSDITVTSVPQVDFESLRAVNQEIVLKYIGEDSWSRPVYRDQFMHLWKDTSCGRYDDRLPIDEGHRRDGLDRGIIKKVVALVLCLLVVIGACVAILYIL